jgi:hypothetical protein
MSILGTITKDIVESCQILLNWQKKLHYDSVIAKSQKKVKTTWRIIKSQTNKTVHQTGIQSLKINNSVTYNQDDIAHAFNNYFISVADSVVNSITRGKINIRITLMP